MQEQVSRYEKFAYDKYMIYLMNCRKSRQKEWGEIVKKGHNAKEQIRITVCYE